MSNSPNIGLSQPTQGDPAFRNNWAAGIINPNMGLIDDYTAGGLSKSVAGSANVVLTYSDAASCEARHSHFDFTGVLTGNIYVLYPSGKELNFSVSNQATGAFTLSLGVNDGSGNPVGGTAQVPSGGVIQQFRSDGTNVAAGSAALPLTTKGDLVVNNGSTNVRLPVGSNNQVLTADSTQPNGVKWATSGAASNTPVILLKGSLSGASLVLNLSSYASSYGTIIVYLEGMHNFSDLLIDMSSNGGSTWHTSAGDYRRSYTNLGSGVSGSLGDSNHIDTGILGGGGTPPFGTASGQFTLNLENSTAPTIYWDAMETGNITGLNRIVGCAVANNSDAGFSCNAVRFTWAASGSTGGKYKVVGYQD